MQKKHIKSVLKFTAFQGNALLLFAFKSTLEETMALRNLEDLANTYSWKPTGLREEMSGRFFEVVRAINTAISEIDDYYVAFKDSKSKKEEDEIFEKIKPLEKIVINKKTELENLSPNFFEDLQKFSELLTASGVVGIDLWRTTEILAQDGKKFSLGVSYDPITERGGAVNGYQVKISLKHEDEATPRDYSVLEFKQLMEKNNLTPNISTIAQLNSSVFIQKSDLAEGQSFFTADPDSPKNIIIKKINPDSIVLDNAVKPYLNDNFSSNTLSFGQFAILLKNRNYTSNQSDDQKDDISILQDDFLKDMSSNMEGFLPYEEASQPIDKELKPYHPSYWKDLKENTMGYTIQDIIDFFKHIWDNYKGNREVLAKYRQGKLGEAIFSGDLKEHFKQGKRKDAERAMMEGAEKLLKSKPPESLIKILRTSQDKFHLEVAFNVLSEQGFLNLWDPHIWSNLFKKAKMSAVVPMWNSIDPNSADSKLIYDKFAEAVNIVWDDPNQFSKWERAALSNCSSKVSGAMDRANRIISSVGFAPHMEGLLKKHKDPNKKEPVDPHEYEAMLKAAMENGKGTIEEKLYYLIQGITLRDKKDNTILSIERLAQLNKSLSTKYIPLQFLLESLPRASEGKEHPVTRREFESFGKKFEEFGGKDVYRPNKGVRDFLWNTIITNPVYKSIAGDQVRNLGNLEGTEAQYFIPLASETVIKSSCTTYGGMKMGTEGFANGFAGFSQYIKTLAGLAAVERSAVSMAKTEKQSSMHKQLLNEHLKNLREAIKSYVQYEAIMTNKFEDRSTNFVRLDRDSQENIKLAGTDNNANHYIKELNDMIWKIVKAYQSPVFEKSIAPLYSSKVEKISKTTEAQQKFSAGFDDMIKADQDKFINLILRTKLTGIPAK